MRFKVSRTSMEGNDETPPCEGAVRGKYVSVDARTFKTPEEYDAQWWGHKDPWFSRGTNHRAIKTGIARDFPGEAWFIELGSLDELMAFGIKHGPLVLTAETMNGIPELEIYDEYRE